MKRAQSSLGLGIIAFAALMLLGGIVFNTGPSERDPRDRGSSGEYLESIIFQLNETDIGRQRVVRETYPNIELGSRITYDTIYVGNNFRLNANPFTANSYTIEVPLRNARDIHELLIYFSPDRISGDNDMLVIVNNGRIASMNRARNVDLPLRIHLNEAEKRNASSVLLTFVIDKPSFWSLLSWNKIDINDMRIVEMRQSQENSKRDFSFFVDKSDLDRMTIDLLVSCEEIREFGEAIKVTVNGYIVQNANPSCSLRDNRLSAEMNYNIIMEGHNTLELETNGYYRLAYSLNKVYFNDRDVYTFTINNFNDIIDVVAYGDFDREVIDIRINSNTISLRRNEVKSIIPYLRFGKNEIRFLNKPVSIKEFKIERNSIYQ